MSTTTPQSPFTALQELQEEQREGCVPETPRTAFVEAGPYPVRAMPHLARDLERELAEKDAKLAKQAAQIVALREALQDATDNCLWRSDNEHPLSAAESQRIYNKAIAALSTPAPKVVLLEDVTPLLDALKIIAANPGASHGPSCLYDSGPISTGAIAKFTAKHPQP